MMIRRSAASLASQHLFYRAELVVYCEGGPSMTYDVATRNDTSPRTLDINYWSQVAEIIGVAKILHFKSVGSKSTLSQIALDVDKTGIRTVTVCCDSDYDNLLGRRFSTGRTAFTAGYSWESDVLSLDVLPSILTHLVGVPPVSTIMQLRKEVIQLQSDLSFWCEIDIALKARDKPCVFDRVKPASSLNLDVKPVTVAVERLKAKLSGLGYRRKPRRVITCQNCQVIEVCFGKLVSHAIYHIVHHVASALVPQLRISYDQFMRVAISETFSLIRQGQMLRLKHHHLAQAGCFA